MGGREGGAEPKRLSFLFSVCGGEGLVELFIYSFIHLFICLFISFIYPSCLFIYFLSHLFLFLFREIATRWVSTSKCGYENRSLMRANSIPMNTTTASGSNLIWGLPLFASLASLASLSPFFVFGSSPRFACFVRAAAAVLCKNMQHAAIQKIVMLGHLHAAGRCHCA